MKHNLADFEFFPTPATFTKWLFRTTPIHGGMLEPCVGDGAIVRATIDKRKRLWDTNDLDPRWNAHTQLDATMSAPWDMRPDWVDWTVTNPPFSVALEIADQALKHSKVGVAMYHRCTLKEPAKRTGLHRSWFREHPPTMTLWCPRFSHMRNKQGKWGSDSACCVWSVWKQDSPVVGDIWPPDSLFDELRQETPVYRAHVDALVERYR